MLEVDVTEGALLPDPAAAREALQSLRASGVRVALDGFGAGRSSLALLRDLPLDTVKIDRTFVAEMARREEDRALVAGIVWGSKLGVQFSLATVALRALPVVILGGLTSVPGAIIGGLIIGVGEKLSEVYLGPYVGGGIEIWFAYMLALVFLLFRPQGLFGEKIIDRV
jgi:hypothetical protein